MLHYTECQPYQCNLHFTCSYAVIACLTNTTRHIEPYDKSLGLSPRHQLLLLGQAGLYAEQVQLISTHLPLTEGMYLINKLTTDQPHCIALYVTDLGTEVVAHVMDPLQGCWVLLTEDSIRTELAGTISIFRIHDCNELIFDLLPTEGASPHTQVYIDQYPHIHARLGTEMFKILIKSGLESYQVPMDLQRELIYEEELDMFFLVSSKKPLSPL